MPPDPNLFRPPESLAERFARFAPDDRIEAVRADRAGTWPALAAALDPYHAANLLEALALVPDTGDWHGSLRIACQMVLADQPQAPNATAQQMRERDPCRAALLKIAEHPVTTHGQHMQRVAKEALDAL